MNYKRLLKALLCVVLLPVSHATYTGGGSNPTHQNNFGGLAASSLEVMGKIYSNSSLGSSVPPQQSVPEKFAQDQDNQPTAQTTDQGVPSDEQQQAPPAQDAPEKPTGIFQAVDTGVASQAYEVNTLIASLSSLCADNNNPLVVRSCALTAASAIKDLYWQSSQNNTDKLYSSRAAVNHEQSMCYARWVVATADTIHKSLKQCITHLDTLKNADEKHLSESDRAFIKSTEQFISADEYMLTHEPSHAAMNYLAQLQAREYELAQLVKQTNGGFYNIVHFVKRVKALPVLIAFGAGWIVSKWAYEEPAYKPKKKKYRKAPAQAPHASQDDLMYYEGGIYE